MLKKHRMGLGLVAGLALTVLACQTVTVLPERLFGRASPTPSAPPAVAPNAAATPDVDDSGDTPLTIGAGPTLGTIRETRVAMAESVEDLEGLADEGYSSEELNTVGARLSYTVRLDQADTPVLWGYGWCATTRTILDDNLATMQVEFTLNGEPVDLARFDIADYVSPDGLECRSFVVVVYDWPADPTTLETRITFTEPIDDGMAEYSAGDQVFTYTVTGP